MTELATGLGMIGPVELGVVMACPDPPAALTNLDSRQWDRLRELFAGGQYATDFEAGYANGRAFFEADDALAGRLPRRVEWTGERRPPGDEIFPADLRVDHVYLVSCKYLSKILHNPSPARLVEDLLSNVPVAEVRDWYVHVAGDQYQALYSACIEETGSAGFPMFALSLTSDQRHELASRLSAGWPEAVAPLYQELCDAVSAATAKRWGERIATANRETVLWRLLRIGAVPYFVLGSTRRGSMRLRIDTPWDWRQRYRLVDLLVEPQPGGQPRIGWTARIEVRENREDAVVSGHVELRWSHGRFAGPPEAKVYLDSPHESVPGYNAL